MFKVSLSVYQVKCLRGCVIMNRIVPNTQDQSLKGNYFSGMFYYLSHLWWTQMENHTIKHLRMDLFDPSLDGEKKVEQLKKLTDYFVKYRGRHHLYGLRYFYVVVFNALHVLVDIIVTHYILNRNFLTYGWNYTFSSKMNRMRIQDQVFPKMSKCNLHLFGPSGTRQRWDGFCVLPMNILNEKMFLVLWYWYFVLLILSFISVFYWFYHMMSPKYRLKHIEKHLKGQVKGNRLKFLNKHFGDWFLLHQLYKNLDFNNFTQLVSNLCSLEEEEASKLRRSETFVTFDLPSEEEENK